MLLESILVLFHIFCFKNKTKRSLHSIYYMLNSTLNFVVVRTCSYLLCVYMLCKYKHCNVMCSVVQTLQSSMTCCASWGSIRHCSVMCLDPTCTYLKRQTYAAVTILKDRLNESFDYSSNLNNDYLRAVIGRAVSKRRSKLMKVIKEGGSQLVLQMHIQLIMRWACLGLDRKCKEI